MAGGMLPNTGPTLVERSRAVVDGAPPGDPPAAPDSLVERRTRPVGRRHCWVCDLPDLPARRFAGLVVSWRAGPTGWSGWTIYVVDDQGDPVVVEAWVPAEHLRPL